MSSKVLKSLIVTVLIAGVALTAGCGKKTPYIPASVKGAAGGSIATTRYIIESPNVISTCGNIALVREGELIKFFVGDSLEAKLKHASRGKTVMFVNRQQSPYTHFMVDFMIVNGDSVKVGEAAANLPALRNGGEFMTPESYVEPAIDDLTPNRRTLKHIQYKNFIVVHAKVGSIDTVDAKGNRIEKFTINLKNVKFIVDDVNDSVTAILRAMKKDDTEFEGGLQYGMIPSDRHWRESKGFGGTVKIAYFKYMGQEVVLRFN